MILKILQLTSARTAFIALTTVIVLFYACKSLQKQPIAATPTVTEMEKPPTVKNKVLVFIKTKGYFHESIPTGAGAIIQLGKQRGFNADSTSDANVFTDDRLKQYNVVIFLSTTMNVLDADQQVAFERYIQAGGGFVGIHAAADTEYDWPWYNKLVGAYFLSHPRQQTAIIRVTDKNHPATYFLPDKWERFDEWYNFKNVQPDIKVLAWLDETTYQGGSMGDYHPFAWYHEFDGGRAFYTEGGHTKESYSDSLFMKHLLGGINYAMGNSIEDRSDAGVHPVSLDYAKSYSIKAPEDNRFTKTVLSNDLNEPMELAVAPDGRVFFTERAGMFYVYDPVLKKTKLLYHFPAKAVDKYLNGLIGITLDPDFATNHFIYFFYSSNTGTNYHQNISRFNIAANGNLDTASEKIIIQVPIDLEVSAHTGGSLAWDKNKNLFISTGDNTVPFESDGYAPLDQRPGRQVYDAQRSAGNPNDLRGKILRIHPETDGSYTIPQGNLFPPATAGTRPEIYVMGCRNPYRISVDMATSYVYWGEVGPDAGRDSRHAPRGYDEFNQARKPGNYGWPYFVGDSKAYNDSDFAAKTIGQLFDVNGPVNSSTNNTGMKQLPPPQKAMIWYPYNRSEEFPLLGDGGRCAMGGPIYHYNANLASTQKLPAYYDNSWFVYDWMRNWVFVIRMDEQYHYKRMERFMPTNGDFRRPIDMEIGPDGVMYMLEYGSVYGIDNEDARLVRIDYNGGNRAPVAKINTRDSAGTAPYKVNFGSASYDNDENDQLAYQWSIDGQPVSSLPLFTYTFEKNGVHAAVLKVQDPAGQYSSDTMNIQVGNTVPQVTIRTLDNSTFFFSKPSTILYRVNVDDKEDTLIDKKKVKVSLKYIPKVNNQQATGHQQLDENYNLGKSLIALSDCKACHQVNAKSVGPSFTSVSSKYKNDINAIGHLANKVIAGGNGVWGEHAMNAHPQLSKEEAMEMVKFVLNVTNNAAVKNLPLQGEAVLNEHLAKPDEGRYMLTASYTDKGGFAQPLTSRDMLVLRPARMQAENADVIYNLQVNDWRLSNIHQGSWFVFKNIDLRDVTDLTYRYAAADKEATIQVRSDAINGPLISTLMYKKTGNWNSYTQATVPILDPGGKHDLYFIFVKTDTPNRNLASIDWVRFEGGIEYKGKTMELPATKKIASRNIIGINSSTIKKSISAKPIVYINKSDCKTCHTLNQKTIGPSYSAIAQRYENSPATINKLAGKVIEGGKGVWGQVPMPAHPKLSKKESQNLVSYILQLKG